jgi:O-antigen biosynthesis protein WbqP
MKAWKRILDLAIAIPGIVLASPFILVVFLAVKVSSAGPAIYRQKRLGRDGRPFSCVKVRTMFVEAPSVPTHEIAPSFITPLGRFLRRYKIDELPQLWNVIKGEMTLVGPRPCLPELQKLIRHREQLGVFRSLPGITGLAQVRGIDMSQAVLCARSDAEYLETMSVWLDLKIILATFISTLRPARPPAAQEDVSPMGEPSYQVSEEA